MALTNVRAAARTVAVNARDADDARLLLAVLGLIDDDGHLVDDAPPAGHGPVPADVVLHEHQPTSTAPPALRHLAPVDQPAKPVRPRPDRVKPAPPARLTPVRPPSPPAPPRPVQEAPMPTPAPPSAPQRPPAVGSPEWLLVETREHPDRAVRRAAANALATWCAVRIANEDLADATARAEKRSGS